MKKSQRNKQLQLFRLKIEMLMNQYAEKMKIFIAEEALARSSAAEIRKMKEDPESSWNKEKEALNKEIRRQAASLINRIHIAAYREGLA